SPESGRVLEYLRLLLPPSHRKSSSEIPKQAKLSRVSSRLLLPPSHRKSSSEIRARARVPSLLLVPLCRQPTLCKLTAIPPDAHEVLSDMPNYCQQPNLVQGNTRICVAHP